MRMSERQRREMTGQTEVHISQNYNTTTRSNKTDIIIIAEETVFIQTLAVLPPTAIILALNILIQKFDLS